MVERYSRQEIYPFIGKHGQKKLLKSTVAIVGLGAIGSQASLLLARAGIGNLILIDRDSVELSNLQRQGLFGESDVGSPKAIASKKHLEKINSKINITACSSDLNNESISRLIHNKKTNLILDCTDNVETRFLINDYALQNNIPWIHAGAIKSTAFLMNIIPKKTPCYSCIFNNSASFETCETSGVLGTVTSLIASLQVSEAFKILLDKNPSRELLHINLENNSFDKFKIKKRTGCQVCEGHYLFLESSNPSGILKFCSSGNYQVPVKIASLIDLKQSLSRSGNVEDLGSCLKFKSMLIFKERCLVKAKSESEAKSMVSRYIGN